MLRYVNIAYLYNFFIIYFFILLVSFSISMMMIFVIFTSKQKNTIGHFYFILETEKRQ